MNNFAIKTGGIFLVLLVLSCSERISTQPSDDSANAPFEISGIISGNLAYRSSVYHAIGDLIVEENSSLTIEPGVKILFADSVRFIVHGNLNVNGSKVQPVELSSQENAWKGIKVLSAPDTVLFHFCEIENIRLNNTDSLNDGAVGIYNSTAEIENCIFRHNYSRNGGALYVENGNLSIWNSVFYNNISITFGGAVLLNRSTAQVINNTFYDNFSNNYGGAIALFQEQSTELQNNIFELNRPQDNGTSIYLDNGSGQNFSEQYNYFENQTNDPHFLSETDFHLSVLSPCRDTGNPDSQYNDVNNTRNDQGAYGGPGGDW